MNPLTFDAFKSDIQNAVQAKITSRVITDPAGFVLIDGFINLPYYQEISSNVILGGPTIPAVVVVGKSTGLIHTFALKALLPNIQF